jgi:DNA-binding CsgD family transcriptional regulator
VHGPLRVLVSTIAHRGEPPTFVHLLHDVSPPELTGRNSSSPHADFEVLSLLAEGIPAKRIATRLGVAEATVRNHIRTIRLQLDCHSQLEVIAEARRHGLLT